MPPRFVQDPSLHPDYPLPDVDDPVMRPFWDGAREGKLMQQRDRVTGSCHWPPKPLYWKDGTRLEWFEASGKGTVFTYVVAYEPFLPALAHLLPHVMVVVALAEGPRIVGHMIDARPEDMRIGLPVRVAFKRLTERVTLPVWEIDA
ncbi:MAG TPA: OB-fold domain-containing protein [Candidatus Limnocylindria bacterium]|nr:OB-fold domain-containing protein [Candidatus Limnocylindria bacterium]